MTTTREMRFKRRFPVYGSAIAVTLCRKTGKGYEVSTWIEEGARCFLCGGDAANKHHLVPVSVTLPDGDERDPNDTVPLCLFCHCSLHQKLSNPKLAAECGTREALIEHPVVAEILREKRYTPHEEKEG